MQVTYGGQTVTLPDISNNVWSTELNGRYYKYDNDEYNNRAYLDLYNETIYVYNGTSADIEVDGINIKVTFYMNDGVTQVFIGTIKNGIINFMCLEAYENGELTDEQTNINECYRKKNSN